QVKKTFERVCGMASDYNLFLISGDVFDSNDVSERTVGWLASILKGINIPVCICPGTHDCFDHKSVYRRAGVVWPKNVHIFGVNEDAVFSIPELDLTVRAKPNTSNRSSESPLKDIKKSGATRWEVAMAHGSIVIPGKIDNTDFPIRREEIEATGLDYIALGHWHSWGDYSTGKVAAFYSGSPECMDFGASRGAVASVTLNETGAQVSKCEVGARRMEKMNLSVAGVHDVEDISREITGKADPELALQVTLEGMSEVGFEPDLAALQADLSSSFFYLRMEDRSHPSIEDISEDQFPETLVIGRYVRVMAKRIEQARGDDEAVSVLEDALRLGVALLQGRQAL
ncbi:MAG: metallophosphoesterase, partial [Armatimonadota bacterium]|nr:metallophosphoesterase [Armatimonadota bacterium]